MTNIKPIVRGTYALYTLATPEHGDQTVEVFNVTENTDHPDALEPGWYWVQPWCDPLNIENVEALDPRNPQGCCNSEQEALDYACSYWGCNY
jgi:hypothetical protein